MGTQHFPSPLFVAGKFLFPRPCSLPEANTILKTQNSLWLFKKWHCFRTAAMCFRTSRNGATCFFSSIRKCFQKARVSHWLTRLGRTFTHYLSLDSSVLFSFSVTTFTLHGLFTLLKLFNKKQNAIFDVCSLCYFMILLHYVSSSVCL